MNRFQISEDILQRVRLEDVSSPKARIVVAMSGGVDSSVTAALMAACGYETIGITLQLYDHGEMVAKTKTCCAGRDIHDAKRVAASLDIAHYVLDYESRFRNEVMEDFASSYLAGETPIPCIRCNEKVKFQDLLKMAKELNAEALVTGHYIASHRGEGGWEMHRPHDVRRDQSYFLFSTTEEQLSFLRFPLANLAKDEVRNIASLLELCVADKPDSQDICFVPNGDYAHIIEKLRPDAAESGDIVTMEGEKLGSHKGIIHYTIGQRRGLGIASGEPLYVVGIDADKHRVIVGPREALAKREISLQEVNWLGEKNSPAFQKGGLPIHARIRSTTEPQPARLWLSEKNGAHIQLDSPEEGVSAGQACVFYSATPPHRRVLGGGWIS